MTVKLFRFRPSRFFFGAPVAALMFAGCGNGGEIARQPPPDVAVYASNADTVGGDSALLQGVLLRDDGCTYVVDANDERWLPIFAKSKISTSDGAIRYGNDRYEYDQEVTLGGGEGTIRDFDTIPASCVHDVPLWRVAQPAN